STWPVRTGLRSENEARTSVTVQSEPRAEGKRGQVERARIHPGWRMALAGAPRRIDHSLALHRRRRTNSYVLAGAREISHRSDGNLAGFKMALHRRNRRRREALGHRRR